MFYVISFMGIAVFVTVLIHAFLGLVLMYNKNNLKLRKQTPKSNGKYNNVDSNAELANGVINVVFVTCFIISIPMLLLVDWKESGFIPALLGYVIPGFMGNVMIPAKLIAIKPEIRNHIKIHLLHL